jgi:hypothetical protein
MRLKVNDAGVWLDDKEITASVDTLEIKISDGVEVSLTITANVDLELEGDLVKLEKRDHVRFTTLNNERRFVRNRL